jgi:hypothetical protein
MSRKIVIAVITALLLAGTLLLLSGGSGGQSMATPSPSSSALPTPSGSIDPSLNDLPQPPVDPTTSCGLYKALVQSSVDVQVFAQAILDGEIKKVLPVPPTLTPMRLTIGPLLLLRSLPEIPADLTVTERGH